MLNLNIVKHNSIDVMSSIDLAELCGQRHSDFKKKATKVIGEDVRNFSHMSKDLYNRDLEVLLLPEREACLMAMSYSYELQAKVYDAWRELSAPKPVTQEEQLLMLAQGVIKLTAERDEAIKTKAMINDKRTATLMNKASQDAKKIKKLELQIQGNKEYITVTSAKLPQRVDTEMRSNVQSWRLLKQLSSDMQLTPKKVDCPRYGSVLTYHVKVIEVFKSKYL